MRRTSSPGEIVEAMAVRHQVFVVEQQVPLHEDVDGRDGDAEHLIAVDGGRVVATCRLLHEDGATRLGRMAVLATSRRQGLAGRLLEEAERLAREAGSELIVLHAQTDALGLYDKAGYTRRGERFMDAGIEHLTMDKALWSELRVDPLTGLRSIIAAERAGRPGGVPPVSPPAPIDPATDPFAEGHEDRTPPELHAVRPGGGPPDSPGWTVRVVPNLYPALGAGDEEPERHAKPDLFSATAARGAHEVVVNAPDPVTSLADLTATQVAEAMEVWRARIAIHAADAAYVHCMVNERLEGGASLPHTHAQILALDFVPAQVARERERYGAYAQRTMGGDLLQDLLGEEVKARARVVAHDDEAVVLAPFASRLPYQLMLAPRRGRMRFEEDGATGAALLHDVLNRLRRVLGAMPPLNLWVRTAPRGAERFCWRIDVLPRLTHMAGLELGTGVHLNVVAPEHAAAQLRDAAA